MTWQNFIAIAGILMTAVGGSVTWIANRKSRKIKDVQAKLDILEKMREDLEDLNGSYSDQLKITVELNQRLAKLETENQTLQALVVKLEAKIEILTSANAQKDAIIAELKHKLNG